MKDNASSLLQRLARPVQKLLQQFRPASPPTASNLTMLTEGAAIPDSYRQSFSDTLFAELLNELPDFQQKLSDAHRGADLQGLGNHVHRLLGAVTYCDAPELETALRQLRRAIVADKADDTHTVDSCYLQVRQLINSVLGAPAS